MVRAIAQRRQVLPRGSLPGEAKRKGEVFERKRSFKPWRAFRCCCPQQLPHHLHLHLLLSYHRFHYRKVLRDQKEYQK